MGQQKHLAYPARTFEVSAAAANADSSIASGVSIAVAQVQVRDWRPLQCRNIAWHQRRVRFENGRDLDDGVTQCVALGQHQMRTLIRVSTHL